MREDQNRGNVFVRRTRIETYAKGRPAEVTCHFTEDESWPLSDSKLALDAHGQKRNSVTMIAQPYQFYVERTDRTKNMSRFYAMSIEPNLFGEICLTRRWGRIGTKGQTMIYQFEQEQDAVLLFLHLTRQKRSRGYRATPSNNL